MRSQPFGESKPESRWASGDRVTRLSHPGHWGVKIGKLDPEAYRQRLEAKLEPDNIRATLGFAGLYQMTHELIKVAVLGDVREFYWRGIERGTMVYDEPRYAHDVLAKAPEDRFRASLLWLVERDAITLAQADRLDDIYTHRHDLSHELIKYIVDPDFEPDGAIDRRASDLEGSPALLDERREGHRLL